MIDASPTQKPTGGPMRLMRLLALPTILLIGGALTGVAQDDSRATTRSLGQSSDFIPGTTQPSKMMDLAFANLGKISEVNVKEGDRIEPGHVLMRQDTAADTARLNALTTEADVAARIALAETQLALAELEKRAAEDAQPAISMLEVERAALEVQAAKTRITEERRQGTVYGYRAEEQQITIEQKALISPEPGVVQTLEAAVGEVFGPQTPALRVVKIDPLHVEVIEAPAQQVMRLKVGDTVQVRYMGEEEWRDAKVTFINPVGIPSGVSSRLPFRAELPNPEGRSAGMRVDVRLPQPGRTADAAGTGGASGG